MLDARTLILPSRPDISVSSCEMRLYSRFFVRSRMVLWITPSSDMSTIGSCSSPLLEELVVEIFLSNMGEVVGTLEPESPSNTCLNYLGSSSLASLSGSLAGGEDDPSSPSTLSEKKAGSNRKGNSSVLASFPLNYAEDSSSSSSSSSSSARAVTSEMLCWFESRLARSSSISCIRLRIVWFYSSSSTW